MTLLRKDLHIVSFDWLRGKKRRFLDLREIRVEEGHQYYNDSMSFSFDCRDGYSRSVSTVFLITL